MAKYKNKYRVESTRLPNYNYGRNRAYFLTICTKNRVHHFGEIVDDSMKLNELGTIAQKCWLEIPVQFSFIDLTSFVVMPNHVHGIVIINKMNNLETEMVGSNLEQNRGGCTGVSNPMLHENLSRVIRWYKGRCSFAIRKIHKEFAWQPLFYEHIIRNDKSFNNIRQYILSNPKNWKEDKLYLKA